MAPETRAAIKSMGLEERLIPTKIAEILGVSQFSVRYVLDYNGERAKSHARVTRWRARRKTEKLRKTA